MESGFRKEWSWTEPPPVAWGLIRSENTSTRVWAVDETGTEAVEGLTREVRVAT